MFTSRWRVGPHGDPKHIPHGCRHARDECATLIGRTRWVHDVDVDEIAIGPEQAAQQFLSCIEWEPANEELRLDT